MCAIRFQPGSCPGGHGCPVAFLPTRQSRNVTFGRHGRKNSGIYPAIELTNNLLCIQRAIEPTSRRRDRGYAVADSVTTLAIIEVWDDVGLFVQLPIGMPPSNLDAGPHQLQTRLLLLFIPQVG